MKFENIFLLENSPEAILLWEFLVSALQNKYSMLDLQAKLESSQENSVLKVHSEGLDRLIKRWFLALMNTKVQIGA